MPEAPEPLLLDLLESLHAGPRPYAETQETWRTSCPRLPVWEDALDAGYTRGQTGVDGTALIGLTEAGRVFLTRRRAGRA
ncbi:hypothetical protein [Muricoccus radiodurans]|uniref:hypothetical protein n=1 Tax=Muricoccus radiodurans TaxID=2231721 RepID=UPI003CEC9FD0